MSERMKLTTAHPSRPCLLCGKKTVWSLGRSDHYPLCLSCNDKPEARDDRGQVGELVREAAGE